MILVAQIISLLARLNLVLLTPNKLADSQSLACMTLNISRIAHCDRYDNVLYKFNNLLDLADFAVPALMRLLYAHSGSYSESLRTSIKVRPYSRVHAYEHVRASMGARVCARSSMHKHTQLLS